MFFIEVDHPLGDNPEELGFVCVFCNTSNDGESQMIWQKRYGKIHDDVDFDGAMAQAYALVSYLNGGNYPQFMKLH